MSEDIEFVDGLVIKKPHENAPDFVKCGLSIKRAELIAWLTAKPDAWVNLQIKESRNGKWYAAVDNWKPSEPGNFNQAPAQPKTKEFNDDIPF